MDSETEKPRMKAIEFRDKLGRLIIEAAERKLHPEILAGLLYVAAAKVSHAHVASSIELDKILKQAGVKYETKSSAN